MLRSPRAVTVLLLIASALTACTGGPPPMPARISAVLDARDPVEPAQLEQRIRALTGVTKVELVSKEQAYERFKEQFKDQPDLLEGTRPESLPASFEVTVAAADVALAEAVELAIAAFDGVASAYISADGLVADQEQVGVIVAVKSDATPGQRAEIERTIRALPRTGKITVETGDDTRKRLRERVGGTGTLATAFDQVGPLDIPTTFRFVIGVHDRKVVELAPVHGLPGVGTLQFVPTEVI